jgi:hypothetical protein
MPSSRERIRPEGYAFRRLGATTCSEYKYTKRERRGQV